MTIPSLNLKQWLGISALILVVGAGSYLSGKHLNPKVEQVEVGQEKIADNTWALRSQLLSERALSNKLEEQNEELSNEIERLDEEVQTLVSVKADLNTTVDSLEQEPDTVRLDGSVTDTSATFTKTFGNELFLVNSTVIIQNNNLTNDLNLDQLRPLMIDVAVTEPPSPRVYLNSPDIDSLEIQSLTTQQEPRFSRTELFIGGTVIGSLLTTTLILTL